MSDSPEICSQPRRLCCTRQTKDSPGLTFACKRCCGTLAGPEQQQTPRIRTTALGSTHRPHSKARRCNDAAAAVERASALGRVRP